MFGPRFQPRPIDRVLQIDRARELTMGPLDLERAAVFGAGHGVTNASNGQTLSLHTDLDLIRRNTRQIGDDQVGIHRLIHIDGRTPVLNSSTPRGVNELVECLVDLRFHVERQPQGLPKREICHGGDTVEDARRFANIAERGLAGALEQVKVLSSYSAKTPSQSVLQPANAVAVARSRTSNSPAPAPGKRRTPTPRSPLACGRSAASRATSRAPIPAPVPHSRLPRSRDFMHTSRDYPTRLRRFRRTVTLHRPSSAHVRANILLKQKFQLLGRPLRGEILHASETAIDVSVRSRLADCLSTPRS